MPGFVPGPAQLSAIGILVVKLVRTDGKSRCKLAEVPSIRAKLLPTIEIGCTRIRMPHPPTVANIIDEAMPVLGVHVELIAAVVMAVGVPKNPACDRRSL